MESDNKKQGFIREMFKQDGPHGPSPAGELITWVIFIAGVMFLIYDLIKTII